MTKEDLIKQLEALTGYSPSEESHSEADSLLLAYIDDIDIAEAYIKIDKWYAYKQCE